MDNTPTPWGLSRYGDLLDASGDIIRMKGVALTGTDEAVANTDFVRKAVNAHDDLVKALKAALEWIDAVPSDTPLPAMPGFDRDDVNALLQNLKAAS